MTFKRRLKVGTPYAMELVSQQQGTAHCASQSDFVSADEAAQPAPADCLWADRVNHHCQTCRQFRPTESRLIYPW